MTLYNEVFDDVGASFRQIPVEEIAESKEAKTKTECIVFIAERGHSSVAIPSVGWKWSEEGATRAGDWVGRQAKHFSLFKYLAKAPLN